MITSINLKWHRRFLRLAEHVAEWSKDPSTKCGAIIVDENQVVVGMGYNGFPRGVEDKPEHYANREEKYPRVVHAELNAILNASGTCDESFIYVWPILPCSECAKAIIQSGVIAVYAPNLEGGSETRDRWEKSNAISLEMFEDAAIHVGTVGMCNG